MSRHQSLLQAQSRRHRREDRIVTVLCVIAVIVLFLAFARDLTR